MHRIRPLVSVAVLALGTLASPLDGQVTISIATDLSAPTTFAPVPYAASGATAHYADLVSIDDLQIEYRLTGCDLGPPRLVSALSVRNLSAMPRDLEIVVTQPSAPLARPTFVTASASATATTLLAGGSVGSLGTSAIFRSELAGWPLFEALPAPLLHSSTGVSATLLGSGATAGTIPGPTGLGDLTHIFRLSIDGESIVTLEAVVKLDATGLPDLDADGIVNGADLGLLLDEWGRTTPFGPGDLNGDGVVDGADLGLLLAAFGSIVGCG